MTASPASAPATLSANVTVPSRLSDQHVFYLEDEPLLVGLNRGLLQRLNIACTVFHHEQQPLAEVAGAIIEAKPTILLIDYSLSMGIKGSYVIRELMSRNRKQSLDFINQLGLVIFSGQTEEALFKADIAQIEGSWLLQSGLKPVILAKETSTNAQAIEGALIQAKFGSL